MKRRLFRITMCLILGIVTTVAVAWGLAWPSRNDPVIPWHLLDSPDTTETVRSDFGWGWPLQSSGYRYGVDVRNGVVKAIGLPLRPIVPGIVVNTLFYSTIWFALFLVPGALRRTIRRSRGLCVKCGYDLRGDHTTGCPECGRGREE